MSLKTKLAPESSTSAAAPTVLLGDIRSLIDSARARAAAAVNSELTMLYWRVGQRIHTEILDGKRGGYGEEVLPALYAQLVQDYGRNFSFKNLHRMVQTATIFPDERISETLSRKLSWSHFLALLPLKDPLQRKWPAPNVGAFAHYANG